MVCVLWLPSATFDVLNFLCCFFGVVLLVHVHLGGCFVVVSCCKRLLWLPSITFVVVNLCVLVCECEGEVSLFLRVIVDVFNLCFVK